MTHRGSRGVFGRGRRGPLAVAVLAMASAGIALPAPSSAASSTWTSSATSGPPADQFGAMAYDQATGTDVLFTSSGQTWTWNGSAWTQQNPAASPSARMDPGMAYDPVHQRVVLFGGQSGTSFDADTWTWDGTTWTQQQPTLSPTARLAPAMAWDAGQSRVVLFGGYEAIGIFYADTWAWDGTGWTELTANFVTAGAGPSPRAGAMMADDPANDTVVMFGGTSATGVLGDTWVWYDGSGVGQWTQASPAVSPAARGSGRMAYSPTAKAPVLFGGADAGGTQLADTWAWDGGGWQQATPSGQPSARVDFAMATAPGGGAVLAEGRSGATLLDDTWTWSGSVDVETLPAPTVVSCPAVGPSPSTYALPPTATGTGTLRGAVAATHPGLYIGAALPGWETMDASVDEQDIAATQENLIVSSNQMWWAADEPEEGIYNYCDGDQFVGMAEAYHQTLRLHNLVAGLATGQLPNWLTSPSHPWTAATLEAAMQQYITTTVTHYKGKVKVYDVVNEAIDDNGNPVQNVFATTIGFPRYIELAFQWAHAADPSATLIYDDYNDWYGAKETGVYNLVKDLVANSHIDGMGFELFATGGWMLPGTGNAQSAPLDAAMSRMASLGVQTSITQMTVPFFTDLPSAPNYASQAAVYSYALDACLQPASHCFMLNTWGLDDGGGPVMGAVIQAASYPGQATTATSAPWGGALFDETYQPYPAFYSVLAELQMTAPALSATAGAGQVALSWTAATSSAGPITGYEVYRGTSTEQETPYQSLGASATSFTDTAVSAGTTYCYRVSAVNATGDGPQSSELSETPS